MPKPQGPAAADPTAPPITRLLMVGLDGATFDVLGPAMDAGRMPNLKALIAEGVSGPLESTRPPITPAAWTTFMTGKNPGKHGILDFLRYDPSRHRLEFNNNQKISQTTIWQILSDKNYKVGSINLPMTFPPEPLKNGFMISGFDTPPGEPFTYPRDLQAELLARYPDYTHEKKWERSVFGGDRLFAKNIEYIAQSFDRGHELARFCGGKYGWDVMMVLLKLVDNLQHKTWRYLDPRTRDQDPHRRDLVLSCLTRLDDALGRLRGFAVENHATLMLMSDHGHGSLEGKAQPNLLLARWGYLGLRNNAARAQTRGQVWWHRFIKSRDGAGGATLDHDLAIDWPATRACVLHAGIYGFLYLNLKGRQPADIATVEPAEFESLRSEIRERLRSAICHDREGGEMRIFPEVFTPEDLYGCSRAEYPWMPDLLLAPADGLAVVKKIRGSAPVRWVPLRRMEGTHRLNGIFVAHGPTVARGRRINAHIADLAPTILAGLGERVLKDMDGRVLTEIFTKPIEVRFEPPQERKPSDAAEPILTASQMDEVATRLGDLGYLD